MGERLGSSAEDAGASTDEQGGDWLDRWLAEIEASDQLREFENPQASLDNDILKQG